jgi:hypothetical protein
MKAWWLPALAAALLGTGCAQTYTVRLSNGQTLTAATKPKLDGHGSYVFKDSDGREVKVNELRVREIEAR